MAFGAPRLTVHRHSRHAAVGAHELACLLSHQPQHLLERVGCIQGERGIGEEARQLTRHLGLSPFVPDGLPSLSQPPLDHLVRGQALEEEVAGRSRHVLCLRRALGCGQRRLQGLLVSDGQVKDAQLLSYRPATELVRDPK